MDIKDLKNQIKNCKKCELCQGRKNVVFGDGCTDADVMIIGEAPGKNEDEHGLPFVGRAGKFLDELLKIAGLDRTLVYIANVVKCRPPSNRNPKADEILQCSTYLRQQTAFVKPKIIVTLGNFATRFILKNEQGISLIHGKPYELGKFLVFPVYHPAATMYDIKKKEDLVKDFEKLGKIVIDI